jgi:hypothetical protein
MQTNELFASASPKLPIKIWGQARCTPAVGGGRRAPTGVGEDDREAEGRRSRTRRQSGTDDVDVRAKATTPRPAGRQGAWRWWSHGGWGGRCRRGGWGGGRHEEEPWRPGQVKEEATHVPGADDGGLAWRGATVSAVRWTRDSRWKISGGG